ncbi:hypothetical protein AD998_09805 [bacterium 336/3]|nr:hypothetical protein AD998_09805 [bacterium 336/3]
MNSIKTVACLFLILTLNLVNAQNAKNPDFDKIYSHVLTARVDKILAIIDSIPEQSLNQKELEIKKRYISRFLTKDEKFTFYSNDNEVQQILNYYYSYWQMVLTREHPYDSSKLALENKIVLLLKEKYSAVQKIPTDSIKNNLQSLLSDYLGDEKKIISVIDFNSTIADIYLWEKESEKSYRVKLPDTTMSIKVTFMEDIITLGWSEFASLNKITTGGFVANTGIYCVPKSLRYGGYELKSEKFLISYLKHETQHFYDVPKFPNLSFADREYRAKLIELVYAKKTLYNLIEDFTSQANTDDRENSHPYADYILIRDLSREIFRCEFEKDMAKWKSVSKKKINKAAYKTLQSNTKALQLKGANVENFIMH